jgi:hypothetical protein
MLAVCRIKSGGSGSYEYVASWLSAVAGTGPLARRTTFMKSTRLAAE